MPRRRTKGTGSIIHRSDGRYEARYRGRSATAASEREAERLLAQLTAGTYLSRRRARPQSVVPVDNTLAGFIPRYLDHCRLNGVSRESVEELYTPALRRAAVRIGHLPLHRITPEDVSLALADLLAQPVSIGTVRHTRAVLKRCLALAEDWGLLDRNPVRGRPPREQPKRRPPITIERAVAIRNVVRGTRTAGPVTLGLYLGLRIGEVLGLRWEDIAEDRLVVRGQYLRRGYKPRTKSGAERTVPLAGPVREALRQAHVQQAEDQLAQGPRYERTGFVFTGPSGKPVSRALIRQTLDHRLGKAGIERATFHSLRHMTATLLHDLGVSEEVRRSILGHASAEVHRGYVHVDRAGQRAALEALERALG
jgi:integrase